jgi:hypothetical protein
MMSANGGHSKNVEEQLLIVPEGSTWMEPYYSSGDGCKKSEVKGFTLRSTVQGVQYFDPMGTKPRHLNYTAMLYLGQRTTVSKTICTIFKKCI